MKNLLFTWIVTLATSALLAQSTIVKNYDEVKVPSYKLPELLNTKAGARVLTKQDWENVRRPGILSNTQSHNLAIK